MENNKKIEKKIVESKSHKQTRSDEEIMKSVIKQYSKTLKDLATR